MIDPRIAERRRTVLERGARRGVRRALFLLAGVLGAAGLIWLLQSPWLSVQAVEITGSNRQDVTAAIAAGGLEVGTPLVLVRPQQLIDDLEALPWVRSATVRRVFPDRVEISIDQRHPVAWLWSSGTYALLDLGGVVLEYEPAPPDGAPVLQMPARPVEAGEAHTDPLVLGALEFVAALEGAAPDVAIWEEGNEVWASVLDYRVRLGRPVDMAAKAAALAAVVLDDVPAGSIINLIAPARPAVTATSQPSS